MRLNYLANCIYKLPPATPGKSSIGAAPVAWIVQLLHGCSFGLYLIASVTLVHELVGAELAATAQGLLASAMAFGQMSGSLLGGVLLDQIGIFALYRVSFGITLLALIVFVLGQRWYRATERAALQPLPEHPGET